MPMRVYLSDAPISSEIEDTLNRSNFSKKLAKAIVDWQDTKESIVIGLHGEWGSGKSSVINLVRDEIIKNSKGKSDSPILLTFNPWLITRQEKLIASFFGQLAKVIKYNDASDEAQKIGDQLITYSKLFAVLSQVSFESLVRDDLPIYYRIGMAVFSAPLLRDIFKSVGESIKAWGENKKKTLEERKLKLDRLLARYNRKIVVVIDDIDRLTREEVKQVFQLVKLNANFPNVVYILPFDKEVVSSLIGNEPEAEIFVEKIIQIPFDLPQVEQARIESILQDQVRRLIKDFPQKLWDEKRWGNLFYGGLRHYFKTLRSVKRFLNSLEFNINLLPKEINPVDFIGLEAIRLFSPRLYRGIWSHKDLFVDINSSYTSGYRDSKDKEILDMILSDDQSKHRKISEEVMKQLFPPIERHMGGSAYGSDFQEEWLKNRRVCTRERFDRYFLLALPDGEISQDEIDQIVKDSGSIQKIEAHVRRLTKQKKIRNFLEKLVLFVDQIPEENIEAFVLGVYSHSDNFPKELGVMSLLDTNSWCVRLGYHLLKRFKKDEVRLKVLLSIVDKSKSIQAVAELISIDIRSRKDRPEEQEKRLLPPNHDSELSQALLDKIKKFAKSDRLLQAPNLVYMLYLWRDLAGNINGPRKYVSDHLKDEKGLFEILGGFMGSSSSQTLGDYIAISKWSIESKYLDDFFDIRILEKELTKVDGSKAKKLSDDEKLILQVTREAIKKHKKSQAKQMGESEVIK